MLDLRLYGLAAAIGSLLGLFTGLKFIAHCLLHPDEEGRHATVWRCYEKTEEVRFCFDNGDRILLSVRASIRRKLREGQTGTLRVYKNRWFRDFTPDP